MPRRILITGASIAGNTAALVLARQGVDVTVVEKASAFRDGGQNIDIRGVGREVMRRLGLEAAALACGTGEEGTAWVDEQGQAVASFEANGDDGPTAEMEILRGDLARLLYDHARGPANYRFGDSVAEITQPTVDKSGRQQAAVRFESGSTEHFDAVIVAEGVGSTTRERVFPGENDPRWMDLTMAFFTIPRTATDDRMWRWYHATDGRSVSLRPDQHGTTRAMLTLQKPSEGEEDSEVERQKEFLSERFADVGWEAPRVLRGMAVATDFYFDVLRQVRLPRWSKGLVALTGDAAWCATPVAGIGSTLAVTGAYVLAHELVRAADVSEAFGRYEEAMRPMVTEAQGIPKLGPRLINPHSRLGIHLLHGALKLASAPPLRGLAEKFLSRDLQEPDLSRYD